MIEILIVFILAIHLVLESTNIQMLILGFIDNHLRMVESPKNNWLTDEE